MPFSLVDGGFQLSPADEITLKNQKLITKLINESHVQVGAIFVNQTSKSPTDNEWFNSKYRDTNLQEWIDVPENRALNVGFNLQGGWLDVDIDSPDPEYNRCVIAAMNHLSLDTRLQFGRQSVGCASHVLMKLGEDESENFDELRELAPKGFKLGGENYHVELRTTPTAVKDTDLVKHAKQTVMPGSILADKRDVSKPDISVWWRGDKILNEFRGNFVTTPHNVNFREVVRAIAFGTFLYIIKPHWQEGSRQETALRVSGWLARVIDDSAANNDNSVLSSQVLCTVDTIDIGKSLIKLVCDYTGDTSESFMRLRTLEDAVRKYEQDHNARLAGWPRMQALVGDEGAHALRTVLLPGTDTSLLMKLSERYLFNEATKMYVDVEAFKRGGDEFEYEHPGLEHQHKPWVVYINGKPVEAFKLFIKSNLRKNVTKVEMRPELDPGAIYRIDKYGLVVNDDEETPPNANVIFNTWRGFSVGTPAIVNPAIEAKCNQMLDQLLGYLTCDNKTQQEWIKKWIAYTIQHPADKQQIAWVVVGGKGVGKTFMGTYFMEMLFGNLAGAAKSDTLGEKFVIAPFMNKLIVFIDEANLQGKNATDTIKMLARNIKMSGEQKFKDPGNYKIYARLMLASNRTDLSRGGINDRAMYYTKAYSQSFMNSSQEEFDKWAMTLKPFFDEFGSMIESVAVREHYMRLFKDIIKVNRHEIEDNRTSSNTDREIVEANLPLYKQIIREIVEEGGNIVPELDISYPFMPNQLMSKAKEIASIVNPRVSLDFRHLFDELLREHLVEHAGFGRFRFKFKIGTLTEKVEAWLGVKLNVRYKFEPDDYGDNTCDGTTKPKWKGARIGVVERSMGGF